MNLLEVNLEKLRSVLGSDFEHGLSEDQVLRNRSEFGENVLFEKQNTLAELLRKIFGDVMMVILILVSLFAFLDSGAAAPFLTALLVVVSYSLYVFFTYRYCARAKAKVEKYCKNKYHVRRNGVIVSIEKSGLVPGDILLLEKGDVMPCDGIILRRKELRILEASVTGRRLPVIKRSYDEVYSEEGYPYFECVLFAGSVVLQGSAKVFVCNTGKNIFDNENFTVSRQNTQVPDIYRIALELKKQISLIWILACFLLFAWGIFRGQSVFDMFYFACAVVIAAFPDSIEHLSDLSIAFMTGKLFDAGCVLRNPASIDRLCDVNSVFVNSSDYLYYSHPVAGAYFIGGRHYSFEEEPKSAAPLLENILLSQSSQAYYRALPNREEYYVERALLAAAAKIGIQKKTLEKNNMYIARFDFDDKRGFSCSLVMNEGGYRLIVRGRVNDILPLCSFEMKGEQKIALNESGRSLLRSHSRSLAGRCEKTCAVAIRDLSSPSSGDQRSNCRDMTFLGIFGLYTPVSGESARAINTCRRAGINTYLLTDDYPETVAALSKSVSIIREGDHQSALDYRSYQRLDRGVFIADLEKYKAFCGFPAEEKQSIVQYHKEEGNITLSLTSGLLDTLPQMESDISFVSLNEPSKAVIQNADFLLREKSMRSFRSASIGRALLRGISFIL